MSCSGFLNVLKPSAYTSSDVVVKVRGMLRRATGDRQIKVGHIGTLDPAGMGVLPIAVGKATKLFDSLLNTPKTYIASFRFGMETDTLDGYGAVTAIDDTIVKEVDVVGVLATMKGVYAQMPPSYSAKSINGRRAYDLAREGKDFTLVPKNIEIFDIELLEQTDINTYLIKVKCSAGTYIRALARDIAAKLGTVGYMRYIIRTESHSFGMDNSVTIEELSENVLEYVQPIETAYPTLPRVTLDEALSSRILNGVEVKLSNAPNGYFWAYIEDKLFGLMTNTNDCTRTIARVYE